MRLIKFTLAILGLGCCLLGYCPLANAAEDKAAVQKPDVRLLIDISGSMKENDPNNLRVPALQLVTNLLPQGADAGVWAFGKGVNMLVPLGQVDSAWQEAATQSAKKINSAGLFTNIGGVLEKSIYGWSGDPVGEKRSLILLTDGVVDISKDPKVNSKERERILRDILPGLVKAKVTVHTVALSQNADHELLRALATQTDGWYQAVDSADELQKVFLKIFEQSAARDSLPLTDNRFKVDPSIDEMTLLVFKAQPTEKVKLIAPDGTSLENNQPDGSVRWFRTDGYDLITVKSPTGGEWQIDAKVDPDNRVMVVSKLSLAVAEVPNNLLAGEAINYQVALLEDGEVIGKKDFLDLVETRLVQNKSGKVSRLAMFHDSGDHKFKQNFFTDSEEGVLNLTLEVKSPTFERTRNHAVNVYGSPLTHELNLANSNASAHQLLLSVREDIVQSSSLKVNAAITFPSGEKQFLVIEDLSQPVEIRVTPEGGDYEVSLDIKGKSILDRAFSVSPAPIQFSTLPTEEFMAAQLKQPEPESEPEPDPVVEAVKPTPTPETPAAEVEAQPVTVPAAEAEEAVDWTLWLLIGLGGNIILGGLGFLAWTIIKKKGSRATAVMAEELAIEAEDDDDEE